MKKNPKLYVLLFAVGLTGLLAGCWGSSKSTSLDVGTVSTPARVGSAQCTTTCHAATPDSLGNIISTTWANAIHGKSVAGKTPNIVVECEDCHGGGAEHWGVGPIPYPSPSTASCANALCHGLTNPTFTGFASTAHGNPGNLPDKFFFQPDAGTAQATSQGAPLFKADGVTPVTRAQHIEECSRCHNATRSFAYGAGGVLTRPHPDNMPKAEVTCGSCHYGHNPVDNVTIPQRTATVFYPKFRNYKVDGTLGAQTDNVAAQVDLTSFNLIFQPNGAAMGGTVSGRNNEIQPDRLCAACHTKGIYKYAGTATHQEDVWTQWRNSGHGDRTAPAFGEFSADPPAYDPSFPSGSGTHQGIYPFDMALENTVDLTGFRGATATTARNAAVTSSSGFNDNFPCYKCHHGVGSIAHQDNVDGTSRAPVLLGDVTVTCITCHNPHTNVAGQTKNTRKPTLMVKYYNKPSYKIGAVTTFGAPISFSGYVFYDNTAVPSRTGNATICVFCHQGRESGLTLFLARIQYAATDNNFLNKNSFFNPHYLGTAAMVWAANGFEYGGKSYGANAAHQGANCPTCHMANATADASAGGHTWMPNYRSCNSASCHGGAEPTALDNDGTAAPEVDSYRSAGDTTNYLGTPGGASLSIAQTIQALENNVILILAAQPSHIYYNDTAYPYFSSVQQPVSQGFANAFKAWVPATLKAAFNLSFVIKGLPSAGSGTDNVSLLTGLGGSVPANGNDVLLPNSSSFFTPNASAAVHNHRYTIQLLMDSYTDVYNYMVANGIPIPAYLPNPVLFTRPAGTRPATNYASPGGGAYSPWQ